MVKSTHPNHEDKIKRLNRIVGQLKGIIKIICNMVINQCATTPIYNK